ncbi:MAG: hypothetical protein N2257_02175 [Thermodesulfovibrionales bacterium]|nr:hypothetical protein [Thermodesulfovibrionales bacterium]
MKNFILKIGQPLVGIAVIFGIITTILYAYLMASIPGFGRFNVISFLIIIVFGIAAVILGAFLIYLFIDIRDELRDINKKIKEGL